MDVVDVGAGGAGEAEAVGALLDLQDVGARGAEHQHDACRDMWLLRIFMRNAQMWLVDVNAAPNFKMKPNRSESFTVFYISLNWRLRRSCYQISYEKVVDILLRGENDK